MANSEIIGAGQDTARPAPKDIKPRQLSVSACSVVEVRDFIEMNHYSHNINGVKISYCFKVLFEKKLVGAVLFGAMSTTAWKKFAETEGEVLELRRLVLLDNVGKNSESYVIAICLKWIFKHDTIVNVIVSYADPQHGHSGIIYKASNFEYLGVSAKDKGFLDTETGKTYHSRALRTKYNGDYKPFVKRLREKKDKGVLVPVDLPGKHCFVFKRKKRIHALRSPAQNTVEICHTAPNSRVTQGAEAAHIAEAATS